MKITILSPSNLSGGVRVVGLYAEKLATFGHDVEIVSVPRRPPKLRKQIRSLIRGKGLIVREPSVRSHFDGLKVPHRRLPHVGPITDRDLPDADVVVATWWETAVWAAALSPSKGAKVYFMQDYGVPGQSMEKLVPTWRLPMKMITISQWLVDLVRDHVRTADVALVQNSVDMTLFQAPARGKQPVPTVGLMYRQAASKGVDTVVAAVKIARRTVPDLRVLAFGSRQPTIDWPIPEETDYHLLPADEDLPGLYAACDAWIFSSRHEGFGLPILEAMACRTPVIATMAGAAPELVTPATGALVPVADPAAMAAAIVRIVSLEESSWRAMSEAASERCRSYSWDDAARAFEAELIRAVADTTTH